MAKELSREPAEAIELARRAAGDRRWEEALDAFEEADRSSALSEQDLEDWATAAYLLARLDSAVEALSRAYQLYLDSEDAESAARCVFWVIFMLFEMGDSARAGGWMSRFAQLVETLPPDSVLHAYSLCQQGYVQVAVEGDYEAARSTADEVIEIGSREGDDDIRALAFNIKGRALMRSGSMADGLAALDDAMLAVTSGRLSPVVVGTVYCSLIEACEEAYELRRAYEWTEALTTWCERHEGEVPFTAQCLVHRSKIHYQHGELKEAEETARKAYQRFARTPYELGTGRALYQLAEVQRIAGQLDDAEQTYRQASQWGVDPQPGLALLRLAQGDTDAAAASMRRLVAETKGAVERIGLLPAHVEVMLAAGDLERAGEAASELAELAVVYQTDALRAEADYANGAVSLARGDPEAALAELRSASQAWMSLNAPLKSARARMLVGQACHQLGDEDTAALEISAASRQFVDLGVPDMTRESTHRPQVDLGLTAREIEVLRLLATGDTNQTIAEELHLSVKTIDRHVSSILTKLGVSSRTGAVAHAYENDLL